MATACECRLPARLRPQDNPTLHLGDLVDLGGRDDHVPPDEEPGVYDKRIGTTERFPEPDVADRAHSAVLVLDGETVPAGQPVTVAADRHRRGLVQHSKLHCEWQHRHLQDPAEQTSA